MDGVCSEQEHKFQSAHQLCLASMNSFRDLNIPPHKLLTHRLASLSSEPSIEMYQKLQHHNDSPRVLPEETLFMKSLPNIGVDGNSDPFSSDEFRMYEFKIRMCTRTRSHDWTECPFAHPTEKARRRCPRRYNYSGAECPEFRRGNCSRGDTCGFSHGIFESWLHPSRYRTEACKDGKNCQRKICFFAHTPSQLRPMPSAEMILLPNKHVNSSHCGYRRCHQGVHHTTSPTSTLDMNKRSPPTSPSFSLVQPGGRFSPISRFSDRLVRSESCGMTQIGNSSSGYKDFKGEVMSPQAMKDLMHSMKAMNINAFDEATNTNTILMDYFAGSNDRQSLFYLSPSTPSPSTSGSSRIFPSDHHFTMKNLSNEGMLMNESYTTGPDLDRVNNLLT